MAARPGGGGEIDQGVLLFAGFIVGLFAIRPLANVSPPAVNGFLLLVLLSALLLQRDRWLPYLTAFNAGGASSSGGSSGAKRKG